jgi:hypothetical protein
LLEINREDLTNRFALSQYHPDLFDPRIFIADPPKDVSATTFKAEAAEGAEGRV